MHAIAWHERQPGHFEVDLVHHGGPTSDGQYIHTLQLLDIATAWSERVAVLGRSYLVMEDGFRRCQARLPFPIVELHPDNGVEFLNDLMVRFWKDALPVPHLSRSRPYRKNDNRFVEQKNRCLVPLVRGWYAGFLRFGAPGHGGSDPPGRPEPALRPDVAALRVQLLSAGVAPGRESRPG